MASVGVWGLWHRSTDNATILRQTTNDGGSFLHGPEIECPDALTMVDPTGRPTSTCVLRAWPQDRAIVYFAGRSDTDGHMKCWRYDGHTSEFTQLLDEDPTSGTWPFATGLWLSHGGDEEAWLVTGNGSGWGAFANQNTDGAQTVWHSVDGAAFEAIGPGRQYAYAGSNINNPNSLQDIIVYEGEEPELFVSHSVTKVPGSVPNTYPYWFSVGYSPDMGVTWVDIPHPTGMQFMGAWVQLLSLTGYGFFQAMNGSGTGPYAFPDTNFGTTWVGAAPSATGIGAYEENSACLVYFTDSDTLLSFDTAAGAIYKHSPVSAGGSTVASDANWGNFSPTSCRLSETDGAAVGLTSEKFGLGYIIISDDFGDTWHVDSFEDYAGLAVDFGEAEVLTPTVYEEVVTWRDSRNFTGHSRFYVKADTFEEARNNAAQIVAVLVAASNAHFEQATGPFTTSPTAPTRGEDNEYNNIEMILRTTWITEDGFAVPIELPCPVYFGLLSDQETISILETVMSDLISVPITYRLCTRGGLEVSQWVGVTRIMRGFRSRETIRTLDPTETIPSE